MAFDAFLKIDKGDTGIAVQGESQDKVHSGEIEIKNFSWGATNPVTIGSKTAGAGVGKLKFKQLIITKNVDQASSLLFKACVTGAHFPTATLTVRKAGGVQLEYLVLTFGTVFVGHIQTLGNTGDDIPTEQITFVFGSLKMSYQQQASDGKAQGGPILGSWNQVTNSANT